MKPGFFQPQALAATAPPASGPMESPLRLACGRSGSIKASVRLFAALGFVVALTVLLVPRGVDLAALVVQYGRADKALEELERATAGGDNKPATVAALARVRARSGDLHGSIELLRRLTDLRPDDMQSLQLLADALRATDRIPEYLGALETLEQRVPTAARRKELARLYAANGSTARHIATLEVIIGDSNAADVADYLTLARLLSQQGDHAKALSTLDRMVSRHADSLDASVVAAQISASVAMGDATTAMARGRRWLQAHPKTLALEAPMLAGALGAGGRPDLGAALLEPFRSNPDADDRLRVAWAQAMSDSGHPDLALAGIRLAGSAVNASIDLARLQMRLAVATGQLDAAIEVVRAIGVGRVPSAELTTLAAAASAAGRVDVLRLIHPIATEAIGTLDAPLAARVAIAVGDRANASRWIDVALRTGPREPGHAAQLVSLLQKLGRSAEAFDLLQTFAPRAEDRDLTIEYARLHIGLRHAAAGLQVIDGLRRTRADHAFDEAWALLATAQGRHAEVLHWLTHDGTPPASTDVLRDVLHLAMDGKGYELAIASGRELVRRSVAADDRSLLGHALLAAGRPREAIAEWRALGPAHTNTAAFVSALFAAWQQGAPVAEELRARLIERLAREARPEQRHATISALLALGANAELLPSLEPLVLADPQQWLAVFEEAAAKAGQHSRLQAMWAAVAEAGTTPSTLREQIAFRLLDAGQKPAAELVLRTLAATAAPDDPATRRLLFVWGPRPASNQLEWLESRALGASGADRAAWMRLLNERDAPARTIAIFRKDPGGSGNSAARDAYLDAVLARGDKREIAAALRELALQVRGPEQLGRLAKSAPASGDDALQRRLLEAAMASGNRDPELQRALGLLAYRKGDTVAAEQHLTTFNERTGGDVYTNRAVGGLRLLRRDTSAARQAFESALDALERDGDLGFEARVLKAGLLHQLGRTAEAQRLYASLLSERPADNNLRADYVALLLDIGQGPQAKALLASR